MVFKKNDFFKIFEFFILFFILIISLNLVSSKFICGEVFTEGKILPSWQEVRVYPVKEENISSYCEVSPEDFKYCCDIDSLEDFGYYWEPGDFFGVEIVDPDLGVFTEPVFGNVTEKGYDVFSPLRLKEAIRLLNPNSRLVFSKYNLISFEVDTPKGCDFGIFYNESKNLLLKGGGIYSGEIPAHLGLNNFEFYSLCNQKEFHKNFKINLIDSFDFNMEGFSNMKKGELKKINLGGSFLENISGLTLKEYVPLEFKISSVSNGGKVDISTSEYNVISWVVNESKFNFSYSIKSSMNGVYTFISELGGLVLDRRDLEVGSIFSSGGEKGVLDYKYVPDSFSKVSGTSPLVYSNNNLDLAIYSKNFTNWGSLFVDSNNFSLGIENRSLIFLNAYFVNTNLNDNFDHLVFNYLIEKSLRQEDYKGFQFYGVDLEGNVLPLTGKVISNEGENIEYSFESDQLYRKIFIYAVKNKLTFWDKIVEFYWKIKNLLF